jgi:hypothetical protein
LNNQDLIKSGILESYVLGLASRAERDQVKRRIEDEGSLRDYLVDLETNIQAHFTQNSVPPPAEVRDILLLRDPGAEVTKPKHVFNRARQYEPKAGNQYLEVEVNDTHIKVHKYWRPAFIAVFILSKIFLIAGLYYYFQSASLKEEIQRLKTEIRP